MTQKRLKNTAVCKQTLITGCLVLENAIVLVPCLMVTPPLLRDMKPNTRSKRAPKTSKKIAKSYKTTGKGKSVKKQASAKKVAKKARKGSAELTAYFKTYKGGLGDIHIPVFRALKKFTAARKVLYPGCHRHITASLFFESVVYVDNYVKIRGTFSDEKVLDFVKENKEYTENPDITFKCKNFESDFGEKPGSFDLLMSLSAGIVSTSCGDYVKKRGYFLASDAHFDARMTYIDPRFELLAVYNNEKGDFDVSDDAKKGHFTTTLGKAMTKEMVQESIDKPKAKRSFKLQKETLFYLFQRK